MIVRRLALVCCLLAASACTQGAQPPTDELDVVAAFYPLAEAAERIGGEQVRVTNLTAPGAEPHDIELTTRQLDQVLDADAVVYLGGGFQPALEDALEGSDAVLVDVLEGQDLLEGEEHGHEEEEEHTAEEAESSSDPHIWLDPVRWSRSTERIEAALSQVRPDGAEGFAERGSAYREELASLDEAFERGLINCERSYVVTSHAAFAYLTDRYGLEQEAVSGLSPEAEPDPARLAELADLIAEEDVTTIYTEALVSAKVAETLARETGAVVDTLDPIEGLTQQQLDAGEDYVTVMERNLDALRAGLGCR